MESIFNKIASWSYTKEAIKAARTLVSGDKYRFTQGGYDLDLTYITPRLIAMGYPAIGTEVAYRNDAADVIRFLKEYHPDHFLIMNVSERDYKYLTYGSSVLFMGWQDHHSPPMLTLLSVVEEMDAYLSQDERNVVACHCMAGRSRTGTIIASYFLYVRMFETPTEAINYFNVKRSAGPSLTLPSQLRAVRNFHSFLQVARPMDKKEVIDRSLLARPKRLFLNNIVITPVPRVGMKATGCYPIVEIYDETGLISPDAKPLKKCMTTRKYYSQTDAAILIPVESTLIAGDVLLKFYHISGKKIGIDNATLLFRITFHTSFTSDTFIDFYEQDLDSPNTDLAAFVTYKIFGPGFRIRLLFNEVD